MLFSMATTSGAARRPAFDLGQALSVVFLYSLYLFTLAHRKQTADTPSVLDKLFLDFSQHGNFTLARAPAAVHLERSLDLDAIVGICYDGKSMLDRTPDYLCQELHCLRVDHLQVNIDLWENPLRILPGLFESKASQCQPPSGGQAPTPSRQRPLLSFILTMHTDPDATAQSLLELFRTAREATSAEYIVVDDGSASDSATLMQTLHRLEKIFKLDIMLMRMRNTGTQAYGAAIAEAVHLASGKYIVLINSDVLVAKGWLLSIMHTFVGNPKAGMVGPMFVGDNGLVIEAGGMIFNDGGAASYGHSREPDHSMYFMRKADYISAACLVLPNDVYEVAGGFDPQDIDLAMAVHAAGMDVLVQPLAVVFRLEGSTYRAKSAGDVERRLFTEARQGFVAKWHSALQEKHCPPDTDQFLAFSRTAYPRILWVDDIVPEPDRDSGSVRNMHLLGILLTAGYQVTFAPISGGRKQHYATRLRHMGVQVIPTMPPEEWVLSRNGHCMFDVILVARRLVFEVAQRQISQYCPVAPIIYDTVDLHFLREAREAMTQHASWDFDSIRTVRVLEWLESDAVEAAAVSHTRDSELHIIDKARLTVVVSPWEVGVIRHYRPAANVAVVSNIHELGSLPETTCQERLGTLFVGNMNHAPNRQAVEALIHDVLPFVVNKLPAQLLGKFKMNVVGANEVPESLRLLLKTHDDHVIFHGQLSEDQLSNLYSVVRVAVAPLLSGAGVKGKVNQAMKYGVPVVATPIAVEGMHAQDGVDCLVASSPEEFAEKIMRLHSDCDLWERLVHGGRSNVQEYFSVNRAKETLLQSLESVGLGPGAERRHSRCLAVF